MTVTIIGYARAGTEDQKYSLQDQIESLKKAGAENVFSDPISGAKVGRPQLTKALEHSRPGDVFMVTKLDRLGRGAVDIINMVDALTQKGVKVRILDMDIDINGAMGRAIIGIFSTLAELERRLLKERQEVGIKRAQADGKYKGRKPTHIRKENIIREWLDLHGKGSDVSKVARALGYTRASLYRLIGADDLDKYFAGQTVKEGQAKAGQPGKTKSAKVPVNPFVKRSRPSSTLDIFELLPKVGDGLKG